MTLMLGDACCLLMVVNRPVSWGSLLTGSASRQVMGSDGPYTYQILEGFFFLKLIYTAGKKISLPFRNYQAIKHNYSMAPGKTCVVMVKWCKMKEFRFLSYCSRYFITVRNRERERENKRSRPPGTERGREKTKGRGLLDHGLLKKRRKVNIKQLRSPSTILDLAQLHDYFPVIFSIMHVSKEKGNGCLRL